MEDQVKRPPIIWITQIGLLLWSLMIIPTAAFASAEVWDRGFPPRQLIWGILMGVLPLVAFWALVKRAAFARELAMLSVVCTWTYLARVLLLWIGISPVDIISQLIRVPELVVILIAPLCLLPVLFVKLSYGKKASEFFNSFSAN